MEKAIEGSKWILELPHDWDGEGSPPYSRETWDKAVRFLLALATRLREKFPVDLDPPRILPSADGSIDIHWQTESYELLVNIPTEADGEASYYGDNKHGNMPIEDLCPISSPDDRLVAWLRLIK